MQVGISIAQTGPLSMMGTQALKGIRLWISRLQSEGGLRVGHQLRPVLLISRDDRSRASLARENTRILITEDGAEVLFGPYSSHLTRAACEISEAHQKLLWNHGGASREIFKSKPNWIVSTISPANKYLQKLPEWIARQDSSVNRYLLLSSSKGTFASDVAAAVREATDSLTKTIRLQSSQLPEKAEEFLRLLNETSPEVLVFAGRFEQEIALLRTRPTWPKSIRYVACVAAGDDARIRDVARDLDVDTFYGRFQIDSSGHQIGHEMQLVRWNGDRKIVIT
jgi:ABC-type branched-subunit amino acid transport system substrate-binding protein